MALWYFLWLKFNTSIYTCLILFGFPFPSFFYLFSFFFFTSQLLWSTRSTTFETYSLLHPSFPLSTPILHYWVHGREQTAFFGISLIQTLFSSSACELAVVWIRLSPELSKPIWIKLREPFLASHRFLFEVWKCQLNFYSPAAHFLVLVRTGMLQYQEKLCSFDIFRSNERGNWRWRMVLWLKELYKGSWDKGLIPGCATGYLYDSSQLTKPEKLPNWIRSAVHLIIYHLSVSLCVSFTERCRSL